MTSSLCFRSGLLMQCRALERSSVVPFSRSRNSFVCRCVSQPHSHSSVPQVPLVPPTVVPDPPLLKRELLVSTHHRRRVHLSAVVYAPQTFQTGMTTSEIAFATGNENKLKEVSARSALYQGCTVGSLSYACMSSVITQVVAILEAGHPLPFAVRRADVDLPELQVPILNSVLTSASQF